MLIGAAGVALFALGWYLTSGQSATSSSAQNAVNPQQSSASGAWAQGTMPDFGNLLSYNQVPGLLSAPQATSVDPFSANYGVPGG